MKFLQTFEFYPFLDTVVALAAAFVLGTLIGADRQYRQRTAGLRTNVLVAVGAAAFVDLAQRIAGTTEAVRVISYVVSGIGFLGAGAILPTSMDTDGMQRGYDLPMTRAIADAVKLPVIASGGAGSLEDLYNGVVEGHASSLLVASIAHFGTVTIRQMKEYLTDRGVPVQLG